MHVAPFQNSRLVLHIFVFLSFSSKNRSQLSADALDSCFISLLSEDRFQRVCVGHSRRGAVTASVDQALSLISASPVSGRWTATPPPCRLTAHNAASPSAISRSRSGSCRRRQCIADAGADHDFVPVDRIGLGNGTDDPAGQHLRLSRIRHVGLDDDEFVAPDPRREIVTPQQSREPVRYRLEKRVPLTGRP